MKARLIERQHSRRAMIQAGTIVDAFRVVPDSDYYDICGPGVSGIMEFSSIVSIDGVHKSSLEFLEAEKNGSCQNP